MCTQASADLISEVIEQLTDGAEMFTAFDVSRKVQSLAKSRGEAPERHRHMKNEIHDQMQALVDTGVYQKTTVDVGAPVQPFLYYPDGADPSSYDTGKATVVATPSASPASGHVAPAAQTRTVKTAPTPAAPATASTDDDEESSVKAIDAHAKLGIPNKLVREIGLSHQSAAAYVFRMDGKVYIRADSDRPAGGEAVTTYKVDASDNIRVTQSVLDAAGLQGPEYSITVVDGEIEIDEA